MYISNLSPKQAIGSTNSVAESLLWIQRAAMRITFFCLLNIHFEAWLENQQYAYIFHFADPETTILQHMKGVLCLVDLAHRSRRRSVTRDSCFCRLINVSIRILKHVHRNALVWTFIVQLRTIEEAAEHTPHGMLISREISVRLGVRSAQCNMRRNDVCWGPRVSIWRGG